MAIRHFDPGERVREKELACEQDEQDLRVGRVSAEEQQARNSFVRDMDIKNARLLICKHRR